MYGERSGFFNCIIGECKDNPLLIFSIIVILVLGFGYFSSHTVKKNNVFLEYRIIYSNEKKLNVKCVTKGATYTKFYWYGQYKIDNDKNWTNVICAEKNDKTIVEKRMKEIIDDELLSVKSMNESYKAILVKDDSVQTDESSVIRRSQ